jgi:hypothetical protein
MKAIQLTQKQKDHLVEMANFYFPPFNYHFWEDEEDHNDQMFGCNATFVIGKKMGDKGKKQCEALIIHWYEFCVRYLLPRVFYSNQKIVEKLSYYKTCHDKNPIGVLYKQYKINNFQHRKISTDEHTKR